ncbi:hypothetical protein ASD56_00635 [Microbacterium sp. Root166]|nr:hypothetical protein ASD56_00635 [Microbacterium sp. Root166]
MALGLGAAVLVSGVLSTPGAMATPAPTEAAPATADDTESAESEDGLLYPEDWDIAGPAVEPANDEEQAALAAVEMYEKAWESEDCEDYLTSTSAAWREALNIVDCDTFWRVSASLEGADDELKPALITSTGSRNYTIGVVMTMPVDPDSLPGDDPGISEWRSLASYHVRQSGGEWLVEAVHDLDDGREENEMAPGERAESDRTLAQWEEAIVGGNCEALMASTTEGFRDGSGLTDCAALQSWIQERAEWCDMTMEPVDTYYRTLWDMHHDEIIATVEQTCLYLQDEDGNTLDPPEEGEPEEVEFHLVFDWDTGRWLLNNVG